MTRIEVPTFTPCGQCANGNLLRNGRTEKCDCFQRWWDAVRQSIIGHESQAQRAAERTRESERTR